MGKSKTGDKMPVTLRALIQRINRKLAQDGECLKKSRGTRALVDMGEYFCLDLNRNAVVAKDVDPEAWGRKLGVLKDWEKVVED